MRLLPDGPNIPDELVALQEKGDTIFICGAGVSLTVGLPTFRGLVQRIYDELGEQWLLHPAEREVMEKRGRLANQYDRMLRILEKRLAASDLPKSRGMRERIRAAIRSALAPPAGANLENHMALLKLSRDDEGRSRLITTNFDTLFERVWFDQYGECIASHAGPAMPQPKVSGFAGVLHLHGRLADDRAELALGETDLVLTSAEFGDAYLRSGWASRYVYDVVRAHTVVLVGYEADDPPMRYLLEVLEADRERYADLHRVYAFASCKSGEEELVKALWRAKGVEPILYRPGKTNHDRLYTSLREWKRYADDATAWRRDRLRPIISRSPKRMAETTLAEAASLLMHGDASQLLGELSPTAKWMPVLIERRLFASGRARPGEWIAARIDDADMIRASTALPSIDDQSRWLIERALEQTRSTLAPARRTAWNLILKSKRPRPPRYFDVSWYQSAKYIAQGEAGHESRQLVRRMLQPRIEISKPWRSELRLTIRSKAQPETLHDLVRIAFAAESHPPSQEILKAWPHNLDQELALFRVLERALIEALEEAAEVGFLDGWDAASGDVPSVAPHPQNAHHHGFYPIVQTLADLWMRIAAHDRDVGRSVLGGWEKSPYLLVRRLHLFALCERSAFTAQEAFSALHSLEDGVFWVNDAQVEIMRLATVRAQEFDAVDRESFEARIRQGVPRALFAPKAFDEEKWISVRDSAAMKRLARLKAVGWPLMGESQALLDEIAQRHPKWVPSPADRDDFSTWHESKWGPDGQPELLTDVADDALVAEAMRLQQERFFDQGDIWRVFSAADPERALRGLQSEAAAGRWNADAWRDLVWAASEKGDLDLQSELAEALISMPDATLAKFLVSAAQWLQKRRELLADNPPDRATFFRVWDRFAELAYPPDAAPPDEQDNDVSARAFGEPGGILAATLLDHLAAARPAEGTGFDVQHIGRLTRAAGATGAPGLFARVSLMRNLAYLDHIDAGWTTEHLVPRLSWKQPHAAAMWRARSTDQVGSARLFNAVKPEMLKVFEHPGMSDQDLEGPLVSLVSIILAHGRQEALEYKITLAEIKRALTVGPSALRAKMAWHFYKMMADSIDIQPADKASRWNEVVGPLFREIWPLDARFRDKDSSRNFVLMLLECEGALGEAVNMMVDFIVPYELYRLDHTLRLQPHHDALVRQHPKPALRLASALTDPNLYPPPSDLAEFLQLCLDLDASVASEPAYVRLYALRRRQGA